MADIYNFVNYAISLVWIYKIQILGSLFLALTYYYYFYRHLLQVKKERSLRALKIRKLLKFMDDIKNRTRDELEHDSLNSRMNTIIVQMNSNFEVVGQQLKDILTETKKTNGRVTKLEDTVAFITVIRNNKWIIGFFSLGVMKAYDLIDIQRLVNWIF